ncbi:MAG TPA: SdrD B-like domain-containing protein, partial [Pyrinomonadaceae bacterium]|nr:SdrD B-like domain-containing protein [Pyrinomonadaceae bacterium]
NYTISFRNSGDTPARNVVLRDELPVGLHYVQDSLRLGGRALTETEDGDEGSVVARRIEVRVAQVAVGEVLEVSFQGRVAQGLAHGSGVVNTASVGADNAPAVSSTSATAVASPFGVVYQGRSAGTPVPGARVSLVADSTSGALVPLNAGAGAGIDPNNDNANPFGADGGGRWNFALASAQLGTPASPARYFLNVTAPGYRSRLIETTIAPDAAGLFTLAVRALDGLPVARAGGFELTEEQVDIPRLAAYALNVPMFENSSLEITKSADRPSVEVGDTVTYRVELRNATPAALDNAEVRDQLPPSFHYAEGTALVENPPAPARSVEPERAADNTLVFRLGRIDAGGRVTLVYRVRVGANAREGEQFNTASAAGTLSNGERVSTPRARASVRVRRGLFSSQQVLLGRVYSDANLNGQFDKDERGVPGVRLYLNNGQSVITDSEGLYNFPVVNEGAQVLSLDPVTLADGYRLAETDRRDEQSWTRLLRTPLGGGALLRQNFALRAPDREAGDNANANAATNKSAFTSDADKRDTPARQSVMKGSLFGGLPSDGREAARSSSNDAGGTNGASNHATNGTNGNGETPRSEEAAALAAGTHELATNETLEPLAPGAVKILSPQAEETIAGAALEVEARAHGAWTVAVEVEGQRVPDSKLGERRVDHKNNLATFRFVGLNVRPGPNRIKVTAVGPAGETGQSAEVIAYGRGPAKRIEIVTDKTEIAAGGRDATRVRVRAFDQWGRPAADGAIALEVTSGRLVRVEGKGAAAGKGEKQDRKSPVADEPLTNGGPLRQQMLTLTGGEGLVDLIADGEPGEAEIRATTGVLEAHKRVRVIPEVRPAILVGLAEVTVGGGAPELTSDDGRNMRSRLAFFYRGQVFGSNLLTLAYDSNRALNRTAGRDRLFQLDPLDRAYPIFGDSSTRFEDAQSNSKL